MMSDFAVLCGDWPSPTLREGQKAISLNLAGKSPNVTLKISDISKKTAANLKGVVADLIEIATYVYCADQATARGGEGVLDLGARWRRNFEFFVPARQPSVWSQSDVSEALADTLSFLSEDTYRFTFGQLSNPPSVEQYLEFGADDQRVDEVILFSGGLDSLGGAVQEAVTEKRSLAMVSHRSNPKLDRRQKDLVGDLHNHCPNNRPLHIPVWVHKLKALSREHTQRTRAFLFASLGMAVAHMFRLKRLRFYENGVTSLNLPISEQVVGVRASRTTHPQVLKGFSKLFGLLMQHDFRVENPFQWKTKAEVVNLIGNAGCRALIRHSTSCVHTRDQTHLHTHCGVCSQCVGRRFATLASHFAEEDPREMYKTDLLTGEHEVGPDVTMLESVIRTARAMESMTDGQFFSRFGEASRVVRHLPGTADEVATRIVELHRQYGREVGDVLTKAISDHAADIRAGRLPASCAIALAVPNDYKQPIAESETTIQSQQSRSEPSRKGARTNREANIGTMQPELERLVEGKESIDVFAAARYLNRNLDHVRRLVRTGKLTRVGHGRPIKVSTRSLQEYKGR